MGLRDSEQGGREPGCPAAWPAGLHATLETRQGCQERASWRRWDLHWGLAAEWVHASPGGRSRRLQDPSPAPRSHVKSEAGADPGGFLSASGQKRVAGSSHVSGPSTRTSRPHAPPLTSGTNCRGTNTSATRAHQLLNPEGTRSANVLDASSPLSLYSSRCSSQPENPLEIPGF